MESWLTLKSFMYPHEAHIVKALLESEGVETNLKDELTIQVNNFYSNAIGGVKVQVQEKDLDRGKEILEKGGYLKIEKQNKKLATIIVSRTDETKLCPFCKSENIGYKRDPHILAVILLFVLGGLFPIFRKSQFCYDCAEEWKFKRE